jgi:hypothetical protein
MATTLIAVQVWDANGRMGPAPTLYRGPSDVLKHLSAQGGLVRGLSAGLGTCLLRDGIGCGAMFAVYEGLKGAIASSQVRLAGDDAHALQEACNHACWPCSFPAARQIFVAQVCFWVLHPL